MIYPAKKDGWVAVIMLVAAVVSIGGGIFMMGALLAGEFPGAPPTMILLFALLAFIGANVLWILFGTSYEITDSDLVVRFGLDRRRLPLERIVEVIPTRKFVGRPGRSYALSLDRLDIRYRKANGKISWLVLTISPQDKMGFFRELAAAVPGLHVRELT